MNVSADRRLTALTGALALALAVPTMAEVDTTAAVSLSLGLDSNPLRITGQGTGGSFSELGVVGGLSGRLGKTGSWFFNANGRSRLYSGTSDADYLDGDLSGGVSFAPVPSLRQRLTFAVGAGQTFYRGTYTDRTTGAVFEVPVDPQTSLAIPDRFDTDVTRMFFSVQWRVNRRLRAYLDTEVQDANYVADYPQVTTLDDLDYRSWRVEPGVIWAFDSKMSAGVSLIFVDIDYDGRPALDPVGQVVPGTLREYRLVNYLVTLNFIPAERWKLQMGVRTGDRNDTYAGYYDYNAGASYASLSFTPNPKMQAQLVGSLSGQIYDRAVVPNLNNGEIRANDTSRVEARFDWAVKPKLGWFMRGGLQRTDSRDPIFDYDRDWVLTGVQYTLR